MNRGKYIFAQIFEFVSHNDFLKSNLWFLIFELIFSLTPKIKRVVYSKKTITGRKEKTFIIIELILKQYVKGKKD